MPQELQVLTCYQCETFQVQIVTKVRKWTCKMCGEKQSLKKVYFRGTGKECRKIVQDLNAKRIQIEESQSLLDQSQISENSDDVEQLEDCQEIGDGLQNCYKDGMNKWNDLLSENEEEEVEENECESGKYTFQQKSVKRKARNKNVKEAYAYEDCENEKDNSVRGKRNKQENDPNENCFERRFKNNSRNSFLLKNDNVIDYSQRSNLDFVEDSASLKTNYKNANSKNCSERTTEIKCESSKSVTKFNKWAEDLGNQSDEEVVEEKNDNTFESESEDSVENESEFDISETESKERLQTIKNKSNNEHNVSCNEKDKENVYLFNRTEHSSSQKFEYNLICEGSKRNNGCRNLENVFEDDDEDLDLGI